MCVCAASVHVCVSVCVHVLVCMCVRACMCLIQTAEHTLQWPEPVASEREGRRGRERQRGRGGMEGRGGRGVEPLYLFMKNTE